MTFHIHIQGQVQGVGFRPYAWRLARAFGFTGWVNNTTDGVHILFNADIEKSAQFYRELIADAPRLARITSHSMTETEPTIFGDFSIVESDNSGSANLMLTPDFAICSDCRRELHDPQNRRFGYAFITCTNCGPRYSITQKLPYDRENTVMRRFEMCDECRQEYQNPTDRRFYSQTNSCEKCGIQMQVWADGKIVSLENTKPLSADRQAASFIAEQLKQGKIAAVKGIGGYLLLCDATNRAAIQTLRQRKYRPSKPFALLYPSLDLLKEVAEVNQKEEQELLSPAAPILLLNLKNFTVAPNVIRSVTPKRDSTVVKPLRGSPNNIRSYKLQENSIFSEGETPTICIEEIAPNLNQIGVMLPYAPLLDWIATEVGRPLVATSGNISNSPIIYTDEKAIAELSEIADFVLTHNRPIAVPQDDSVVRFSTFTQQKIVIRRSRGLAPTEPKSTVETGHALSLLAVGSDLKSTFALTHQNNLYISQYLGDLESYETQQNYEHTLAHFRQLLNAQPEVILTDKHPNYFSTELGKKQAKLTETPVCQVQHHIAHFAAVLGENNLLHSEKPVLGVIWDGTGLGDDGQIWGGEFFKYAQHAFLRCYYFDYFDFLSGDKMPREPRLSALAATFDVPFSEEFVKSKFSETEWKVYQKTLSNGSNTQTSSVGRIFDAVASLLDLTDRSTYEGEAAMLLENLAKGYFVKNGLNFQQSYFQDSAHYYRIPTKTLMQNIVFDLKKRLPKDFIAAKFHYSLVHLIRIVAKNLNIQQIAFSGGVFQNEILVDLLNYHLSRDFQLLFHQELSPNDENISFGQLMYYQIQQTEKRTAVNREELVEK